MKAKKVKKAAKKDSSCKGKNPGLDNPAKQVLVRKLEKALALVEDTQGSSVWEPPATSAPTAVLTRKGACSGDGGISGKAAVSASNPHERARRVERQARFDAGLPTGPSQDGRTLREARAGGRQEVFGSSNALEKEYLRLTALPTVGAVRPPPVLEQALARVKQRWLAHADYGAACEQLKAIRQDLTVQHIRGPLAVAVYETHARIALEAGDLAEFNGCQAMLKELYPAQGGGSRVEFAVYGLLYAALLQRHLASELRGLSAAMLAEPAVQHALQVCNAARAGDAMELLRQYVDAPRMTPYLMDHLLERVRKRWLAAAQAAFAPAVPLGMLTAQLGFESDAEAANWCEAKRAAVDRGNGLLVTQPSKSRRVQ
ncbi:hypothetical protein WJX81_004184 [Elliptochloris bilobata]|uniref:SAC3/GANP/THP3 conserved domain-containing protein n=1 Tax=Elliptochloris bilobata TaxID=381761 RepID=A0AAW1S3J8_9CHLO